MIQPVISQLRAAVSVRRFACWMCWVASLALCATLCRGAEPRVVKVWPDKVPGETGEVVPEKIMEPRGGKPVTRLTNITQPSLTIYRPPQDIDTGASVVICPGGGYGILAWDLEGTEIAEWLNTLGVTGIVLKYRVPHQKPRPKHELPLMDAQRAIGLVRSNAKEWGLDPNRIGILGFSAGGHLAATASTNFEKRTYERQDAADDVSCRPDFTVLIYPAYLAEKGELQPEIKVSKETPPTFLAHAHDDPINPEGSAFYYVALKRANVPAELHIYSKGGHGYGLRPSSDAVSTWSARCADWLKAQKVLERPQAAAPDKASS